MITTDTALYQTPAQACGKILVVSDESGEVLKQGLKLAREEKARVTVLKVLSGDRTDRIVAAAEEEQCDLIVMGTRKRKGILGRIFGDTAVRNVIARAACPVYVVGSSCGPILETAPSEQLEVEQFA
jgi:nucleotide-binding universal stress UspA family protein